MKSKLKIIYLLFFLSGISGLIYEVVWTRMLTYLFGATIYAVTTVLSAYMGGLALGSFIFGKIADKNKNNLRLYGVLEVIIGVCAIILPFALKLLHPIYSFIYSNFQASFTTLSLLRFSLTFCILLVPTTMMGATLPVLSKFLARKKDTLGFNIGILYALNTTGAVVGCFASGFFLIEETGIRGAVLIAAVINFLVGAAAVILAKGHDSSKISEHDDTEIKDEVSKVINGTDSIGAIYSTGILKVVLIAYFFSGFVSLAYQVVWSRALVFTFDTLKNTTYSFTAMLTVFLIGLALGSAVSSKIIDKFKNPLRVFSLIQILIGLLGILSFLLIFKVTYSFQLFDEFNKDGNLIWTNAVLNVFAKTFISIFIPTFMMGMGFPIAAKISVRTMRSLGKNIGNLYSFNTVGAIFGSFLCGFFIIPYLGIAVGISLLASINIIMGIILLCFDPQTKSEIKTSAAFFGILVIVILFFRTPQHAKFQDLTEEERCLFYKEGPLATVSVVQNGLGYKLLNVDNVGVAGTDPILLTDQKSLAHYPMLLLKDPKNVLTVGFGSGGASYSYTLYDSLENIHCAEICDTVLSAAPYLLESNHGVLKSGDKRYKIIFDDVRSYLNFTKMKYDVIATDCTDLRYKTNANLYDYEYFKICKEKLTDDGMVCVWMPLAGLSDEAFRVALRTFYKVFNHMSVWYINNTQTHYILLIGTPKPLKIDYALLKEKMKNDKVYKDLEEIYLNNPEKLVSCFITDETKLDDFLKGNIINTENHPYLEFESPKYGYGDEPLIINLDNLMKMQIPVEGYLVNLSEDKDRLSASLKKYFDAQKYIIQGHSEYRLIKVYEACDSYLKAKEIQPEDPCLKYLLEFKEIVLRRDARNYEIWSRWILGELYKKQGRYADAISNYAEVLRLPELDNLSDKEKTELKKKKHDSALQIAACYEASGKPEKAAQYEAQAGTFKD